MLETQDTIFFSFHLPDGARSRSYQSLSELRGLKKKRSGKEEGRQRRRNEKQTQLGQAHQEKGKYDKGKKKD